MTIERDTKDGTIQHFLAEGFGADLKGATIHGWTDCVLDATQSIFAQVLARPEINRTGVYTLFGLDPEDEHGNCAYVGKANWSRESIDEIVGDRGFWAMAVVFNTSDEVQTKGHECNLKAGPLETAKTSVRVKLDNGRREWKVVGSKLTYHEWQEEKAKWGGI